MPAGRGRCAKPGSSMRKGPPERKWCFPAAASHQGMDVAMESEGRWSEVFLRADRKERCSELQRCTCLCCRTRGTLPTAFFILWLPPSILPALLPLASHLVVLHNSFSAPSLCSSFWRWSLSLSKPVIVLWVCHPASW